MEILSYIAYAVLGIALLAFVVLLPLAIVFNMKAGLKYREAIAARVDQLRLSRMLAALGVNVSAYVHHGRITDIAAQMRRCTACGNTETCDEKLATGDVSVDNIGYCENEQSLKELVTARAARVSPPA